ncbi:MAG: hypothetical protein GC154_07175 [bacterium]|nr:hypothetical protein [bacterium]
MALTLICLLIAWLGGWHAFYAWAVASHVVNMVWPPIFKPFAFLWFGLSFVLGTVVSKIVLGIIFFIVVTPVGFLRSVTGGDPMRLKGWKKGGDSVFIERGVRFSSSDVEKPY